MKRRRSDRCGTPFLTPPFSLISGGSGPRRVAASVMFQFLIVKIDSQFGRSQYNSRSVKYHLRQATLADADVLVRHRIGMFSDMGVPAETCRACGPPFRVWLNEMMPAGVYRGWLLESQEGSLE
jgi:hypothetical protein